MSNYDGRYGNFVSVAVRPDGIVWVMADGSQHFVGAGYGMAIAKTCLAISRFGFWLYVKIRGGF